MSVVAEPDGTCQGLWVEVDAGFGYCGLGDECRAPWRDAHMFQMVGAEVDSDDD